MKNEATVEGLKELARTGLLAAIPLIVVGLEAGKVDWRIIFVAATTAVLRGLDKWIHKNPDIPISGIAPF